MSSPAAKQAGGAKGDAPGAAAWSPSRRLLDPEERFAEILFGLIMVVTITGTISVASAGQQEVGAMLRGAVGCNLAWGIADGVMYLLTTFFMRGRGILALRALRGAADPRQAHAIIADAVPPVVAAALGPAELEAIRKRLAAAPEPPARPPMTGDDFLAALGACLLVFASTFPVVVPFVFMHDALRALRTSNAIAIAMLFVLGWAAARKTGARPWLVGLAMVALGAGLVAIIVALGG
ncbi:MAG TPA: hypothetical protein VLU43_00875 [Anaeromyxobacteraceae bacterium]|nr:hypothetical protein [Anaeromyxobacteraceae bacterium]